MRVARRLFAALRVLKSKVLCASGKGRWAQPRGDSGPAVREENGFQHVAFSSVEVDRKHISKPRVSPDMKPEIVVALESITADTLLAIHARNNYEEEVLARWMRWGNVRAFANADQVEQGLRPLIDYAERSGASFQVRCRLRYVTKVLMEDSTIDSRDILCLLASHGTVCNVMKEVAISNAFGLVTNNMTSTGLTLEEHIAILLAQTRELLVEKLYIETVLKPQGIADLNTHQLVGFRNAIAEDVGLERVPDEHTHDNPLAKIGLSRWWEMYEAEMLRTVYVALNSMPRRLDYHATVDFLTHHRPPRFAKVAQREDFLFECFDENGKFTQGALAWMLLQMGFLKMAKGMSVSQVEEELFAEEGNPEEVAIKPVVQNDNNNMTNSATAADVPAVNIDKTDNIENSNNNSAQAAPERLTMVELSEQEEGDSDSISAVVEAPPQDKGKQEEEQ